MIPAESTKMKTPTPSDLLVGFVNRTIDVAAIEAQWGAVSDVEPHELAVGFRSDPQLAWQEGLTALEVAGKEVSETAAPAEWAAIVVRHDSVAAQPMSLANYPQRVRDLSALLQAKDLATFRSKGESREASTSLRSWADKHAAKGDPVTCLLAAAVLRSCRDFDAASALLNQMDTPESWDGCMRNEKAAILWQRGEWEKAASMWDSIPDNTAIWFNRGMAALFLNQTAKARINLKKVIENLPESSGWHHLASLYLALAEIRS